MIDSRRNVLKKMLAGTALFSALPFLNIKAKNNMGLKGNINHSVCQWTFGHLSLEELCVTIKELGFNAIDLVGPTGWETLKKHHIQCSMCNGAEINLIHGFNHKEYHGKLVDNYTEMIPMVAKAGYKNLICFSGNKDGMDDETGLQYSEEGLKKILGLAEKHGVVLQMELLNSKVDHPDYMADNSKWGVELCKRLDSDNFKLLYDIYHMQIDEGDVIRTIKQNHQYYGHYHTAGNPGRNEIDQSQELNYPAIMKAIVDTGYNGYVAQEFIPKAPDKVASLREAIEICDV